MIASKFITCSKIMIIVTIKLSNKKFSKLVWRLLILSIYKRDQENAFYGSEKISLISFWHIMIRIMSFYDSGKL